MPAQSNCHALPCSGAAAECYELDMAQSPERLADEVSVQQLLWLQARELWYVGLWRSAAISIYQVATATFSSSDVLSENIDIEVLRSSGCWVIMRRWRLSGPPPHAKPAPGLRTPMPGSLLP